MLPLQFGFEIVQGLQARLLELADPALVNLVERHGIEVMQFLAPIPLDGDKVSCFKQAQMLGDRLAGHAEPLAQLSQSLPAALAQAVEQFAAAGIG